MRTYADLKVPCALWPLALENLALEARLHKFPSKKNPKQRKSWSVTMRAYTLPSATCSLVQAQQTTFLLFSHEGRNGVLHAIAS